MENITAINWIKNKIEEYGDPEYLIISWKDFDDLINQARKMEKEQMRICAQFWRGKDEELQKPIFELYYNETFGKS